MDRSLHQPPSAPPLSERTLTNNDETVEAGEAERFDPDADPQYREFDIEQRKPPFRMTFKPPFKFDGQEYHELIFDFDSMTGKDFIRAERTFQALYKPGKNEIAMPELKHLYHNIICANLAGVSHFAIQNLERRYYVALRQEALKACGSSPEEENKA
jgi:hypothetical protein